MKNLPGPKAGEAGRAPPDAPGARYAEGRVRSRLVPA